MIRNTTNDDPLIQFFAATPEGIEAQEAQGQRELCSGGEQVQLPAQINHGNREDFEKAGVVFGESVPGDRLFVNATLPAGWSIKPTSHSMWSDIVDHKGRKRGSIFYKAAFYDRDAFMSLSCRFHCSYEPIGGDWENQYTDKAKPIVAYVEDVQGGRIYTTEPQTPSDSRRYWEASDAAESLAKVWLSEHYPDYKNPLAYWD